MGGYVAWRAGSNPDGSDSVAEGIAPASHWPQMRALILVVSAAKKGVPSTAGMQVTVNTSQLFLRRAHVVVPRQMAAMETAIRDRDFETFAHVTMRESNSFHAVCLDSWPPIHYLNDVSRAAMRIVDGINEKSASLIAAYTFDAGPNAVVYYLDRETERVAGTFRRILGEGVEGWGGEYGDEISAGDCEGLDGRALEMLKGGVSRVICTAVGAGPEKVHTHLLSETGELLDS
jgi:diphosphomevalonate decarboxylase